MKRRTVFTRIGLSLLLLLQVNMLGGCGTGHSDVPETEASVIEIEGPAEPAAEPAESEPASVEETAEPEREEEAARQDGERFDGIIDEEQSTEESLNVRDYL